jgi:hypothetical protein
LKLLNRFALNAIKLTKYVESFGAYQVGEFMKYLLVVTAIFASSLASAVTIKFQCKCSDISCGEMSKPVDVTWNTKSQFFNISADAWTFSGYASRQYSKTTKVIYLLLPGSVSFGPQTVKITEKGELKDLEVNGKNFICESVSDL